MTDVESYDSVEFTPDEGFIFKVVSIIVAIVVFACVLTPICSGLSSGSGESTEGGENPNPISELRLTYTEEKIPMMMVVAYVDFEYGGLTIEVYYDQESYYNNEPAYRISGINEDVIIFASDYISMFYQNGKVVSAYVGDSWEDTYSGVMVTDEGVMTNPDNALEYTFLYYPSEDGEYANFSSYQFDAGNMYAVGNMYGITVASKGGEFVGYSPFDVTNAIVKEDGSVVDEVFSVTMGDGTGTMPENGGGDDPYVTEVH